MLRDNVVLSETGMKALTACAVAVVAWLRWGYKVTSLISAIVSAWCSILLAFETWRCKRRQKQQKELRMGGQFETKETCEIIDFGMAITGAVVEAQKNDGKIDVKDLPLLLPVVPTVVPAFEGLPAVPNELGELDNEDLAVIEAHIKSKIPDVGEKWVVIASNALAAGMAIYRIIKAVQA